MSTEIFEAAGASKQLIDLVNQNAMKSEDIADAILHLLSTPSSVNITEVTIVPTNSGS